MTGLIEFVLADDRVSDADRHEDISRAVAFSAGGDGGRRSPDGVYSLTRRSQSVCGRHVPKKRKAARVAPPTANKIKPVLAVALAAATNHGLDLLSGCCSLGSVGLREASIPFRCLSNAIICDLRK